MEDLPPPLEDATVLVEKIKTNLAQKKKLSEDVKKVKSDLLKAGHWRMAMLYVCAFMILFLVKFEPLSKQQGLIKKEASHLAIHSIPVGSRQGSPRRGSG